MLQICRRRWVVIVSKHLYYIDLAERNENLFSLLSFFIYKVGRICVATKVSMYYQVTNGHPSLVDQKFAQETKELPTSRW